MTNYEYVGEELDLFALAENWKRYFARLIVPYLHGSVLEVGAGMGGTTRALWSPRVQRWVCVEPDARLACRLEQIEFDQGARPEIVIGGISAVSPTERFDAIVYIDVLEHIAADADELQTAAGLLQPGGHLIVLSPAFQELYSAFDAELGHVRRYTKRTLAAVFPKALEPVSLFYADGLGAILSFANRLVLRQTLPTRRQILFWDRVIIPVSQVLDPLMGRGLGRSVIGIYRKP